MGIPSTVTPVNCTAIETATALFDQKFAMIHNEINHQHSCNVAFDARIGSMNPPYLRLTKSKKLPTLQISHLCFTLSMDLKPMIPWVLPHYDFHNYFHRYVEQVIFVW